MPDEELIALLRSALPAVPAEAPSHDLWPAIVRPRPATWSKTDLGLAAAACAAFVWQPGWFVWLFYHF
jgi:hypothetical protein